MAEPDIIYNFFQKIRSRFPYLEKDITGQSRLYLNSGAGSLMVDSSCRATESAGFSLNPMPGAITPVEVRTAEFHHQVRQVVAEFIGAASPEEISFHLSTTNALFNLAFSLRKLFKKGRNCLVTDMDHFANISPWEIVAAEQEAEIRRVRLRNDCSLKNTDLLDRVDKNTVLVALTGASNALGTIIPLTDLVQQIKSRSSALVAVDAVHLAPHAPIDVREIGCDFLTFSGYKVFGPVIGVLFSRKESQRFISPYRVETNKIEAPFCWEQGMLSNIAVAGLKGAMDYLLEIGREISSKEKAGPKYNRKAFRKAMESIKSYEQSLSLYFLERFNQLKSERIELFGINQSTQVTSRVPTFAFEIKGLNPSETKKFFWERGRILIADGNHYSAVVVRHLKKEALNRVSLAHHDNLVTVDKFFQVMEDILHNK
jgi:selenocysteine lyase/cysteine desulfurase